MDQAKKLNNPKIPPVDHQDRDALLDRLAVIGRVSSTQTVFLNQAIAQTAGLNATDTKCIDLILRAPGGTLAAGQLSAMSGLSSGAVTHIVDRLERRGFVRRRRDPADRRKVFLQVVPESLAPLLPKYELVAERHKQLLQEYDSDQLSLIIDYLEKRCALSQEMLEEITRMPRASSRG